MCRQQCEAYVRAAPDTAFYFWTRINGKTRQVEEGFDWLRQYGIQPNDCGALEGPFEHRKKTPWWWGGFGRGRGADVISRRALGSA